MIAARTYKHCSTKLNTRNRSAITCMACTALPACHNCERCSQVFTVVHGRSRSFPVVHSCSRLLAVVHSCSRLFTPETGPHSCGRCSRMMNRAHKCESCAQLCTVVHSCAQLCTVAHSCPRLFTPETGPQSRDAMKHAPHHTTCEHCAGSAVHGLAASATARARYLAPLARCALLQTAMIEHCTRTTACQNWQSTCRQPLSMFTARRSTP